MHSHLHILTILLALGHFFTKRHGVGPDDSPLGQFKAVREIVGHIKWVVLTFGIKVLQRFSYINLINVGLFLNAFEDLLDCGLLIIHKKVIA